MTAQTPSAAHEDFNAWYADLRTPSPRSPLASGQHASMADYFPETIGDYPAMSRAFQALADNYDIDGLERAGESPAASTAMDMARRGTWPEIGNSVAHMLVDGGGKEEFARDWMAAHWPSVKSLNRVIDQILTSNDRSKVRNQQLLGLSTQYDFFEHHSYGNSAFYRIARANPTPAQAREDCRILAAVLRMTHPNQLPKASYRHPPEEWTTDRPLAEVLWSGPSQLGHLLTAVDMAYGQTNATVNAQMKEGIAKMLAGGTLDVDIQPLQTVRWTELRKFGDAEVAQQVLASSHKNFLGSSYGGSSTQPMLYRLAVDTDFARHCLKTLQAMGLSDFEHMAEHRGIVSKEAQQWNLLHFAINIGSPQLCGWLLAQGSNPHARTICEADADQEMSAHDMALKAEFRDQNGFKIATMFRASAASLAARSVLDEIAMGMAVRP